MLSAARLLRLQTDVVESGNTAHHIAQCAWNADVRGIRDMSNTIDLESLFFCTECLFDQARIATEVDLHLVRIDAIDGETLSDQPGSHGSLRRSRE